MVIKTSPETFQTLKSSRGRRRQETEVLIRTAFIAI